jgi:hypothetical protein
LHEREDASKSRPRVWQTAINSRYASFFLLVLIFAWCERYSLCCLCSQINTSAQRLMSTQDTLKPYCCCLWVRGCTRDTTSLQQRIGDRNPPLAPDWPWRCSLIYLFHIALCMYKTSSDRIITEECSEKCVERCDDEIVWSIGICSLIYLCSSRDSIVGIATGYGLDDLGVGVRVPVGSKSFCSPRRPHRLWGPLSLLSTGHRGSFPGVKAAGAWSWPLNSSKCRGEENVDLYIHCPIRLHGVVLN